MDIKLGQYYISLPAGVIVAFAAGALFLGLFLFVFFIDTRNPFGEETLKRFSKTNTVLGRKVVDKELGGIIGTRKVPALFIYLLQDKSEQNKLRVVVAQSLGYSVGDVKIQGSALSTPVTFTGDGRTWGALIQPGDPSGPSKFYEKEITASNLNGSEVRVTVSYLWISRGGDLGMYEFETLSATTEAVFPVVSP